MRLFAVQSPEVISEAALADVILEACVVISLFLFGPHVLNQHGLAPCQPCGLVVGESYPVHFLRYGDFTDRNMVQAVGFGIEREQTRLTHSSGKFQLNDAAGIVAPGKILFHFGRKLRTHVRPVQFGIPLAALHVQDRFAAG